MMELFALAVFRVVLVVLLLMAYLFGFWLFIATLCGLSAFMTRLRI